MRRMMQARGEWLPGWRAGLLVLGLYALLLQAFFAALAGPGPMLASGEAPVLCLSSGETSGPGPEPAPPHTGKDCVCSALCHVGGVLAAAQGADADILRFTIERASAVIVRGAPPRLVRALPPARAPPRDGFVLSV